MVTAGPRRRVPRGGAVVDDRRRGPLRIVRLVLTLTALTLVVLAGNSIIRSSSKGPDQALAYADRVRPGVERSTRQAAALSALRDQVGTLGRDGVKRGVDRLVRDGTAITRDVASVHPPGALHDAQGLLVTALTTRTKALQRLDATLAGQFETGPPEQAVDALVDVGRDLAVADRAYELFVEALPPAVARTMPPSRWLQDETLFGRPEMGAFVATLRANASLAPVHDVSVITASVEPAPVGTDEPTKAMVLPVTKTLKVQVVVANAGNTPEKHVTVEAVATSTGGMDTARQFVDLAPGQRMTVTLTLRPSPVGVIELKVRVGPLAGEGSLADNEQTSQYVMRG
jgi:hypothetical protein